MKRLYFGIALLFLPFLFTYTKGQTVDTVAKKHITVDEVDFVSGYYSQSGNHSAVEGGQGTEALTSLSAEMSLTLTLHATNLHTFKLSAGIDHYTSASSDKIDESSMTSASTLSRASYNDTRYSPSLAYTYSHLKSNNNVGLSASYSKEFDYESKGLGVLFLDGSADGNQSLQLSLNGYFDRMKLIYPVELRPPGYGSGNHHDPLPIDMADRNTLTAGAVFTRIINKRLQMALLGEVTVQQGMLATPFHRVWFYDAADPAVEKLPDSRLKIPVALRLHYFAGNRTVLRGYYRFYTDDWGLTAHTCQLESAVKLNRALSVSPFYRLYQQTAANYYAPYNSHQSGTDFFTSDGDLGAFSSHQPGVAIRFTTGESMTYLKEIELRYAAYFRSDGLKAGSVCVAMRLY
jgi:hypothetical protein